MSKHYDCECKKEFCESIRGNAIEVDLKKNDCEVRADIIVSREKCIRIWGQVKDCEGNPVGGALIKLLKPIYKYGKVEFIGVAHTITDCLGFYQFEVCPCDENTKYRIIVSKASTGNERTIDEAHYLCDPCDEYTL